MVSRAFMFDRYVLNRIRVPYHTMKLGALVPQGSSSTAFSFSCTELSEILCSLGNDILE